MTTLTPEKEAEEAVRRYVQMRTEKPLRGVDDSIHGVHMGTEWEAELKLADLRNVLSDLSTQRQAREAAEQEVARLRLALAKQNEEISQTLGKALGYAWFKDDSKNFPDATEAEGVCVGEHIAESLADEAAKRLLAAGKEVEGWKETYDRQSVLMGKYAREAIEAEARLAALLEAAQAVSSATRQNSSGEWIIEGDGEVLSCNLADALSPLPPPVPAEEGGEPARTYSQAEVDSILRAAFPNIPAQAPQDVAGLVEGIAKIIDPTAFHPMTGHIPAQRQKDAIAKANRILSALRASPIGHETETANDDLGPSAPWCAFINPDGYKPDHLELAAADNNHKALVEALKPFAREADEWGSSWADEHRPAQDEARATFTVGDLRRARQALASLTTKETGK